MADLPLPNLAPNDALASEQHRWTDGVGIAIDHDATAAHSDGGDGDGGCVSFSLSPFSVSYHDVIVAVSTAYKSVITRISRLTQPDRPQLFKPAKSNSRRRLSTPLVPPF